jgi:hypothetical protein
MKVAQNDKTEKENLILNDFVSKLLYEVGFDIDLFGTNSAEKTPVKIGDTYLALYSEYPNEYKNLFAYFHENLNRLFNFMNDKSKSNHHYNAAQSRELLDLIESINSLSSSLKSEGVIININDEYAKTLAKCDDFLASTQGSTIPDDFKRINIIKYEPVFFMESKSASITKQQVNAIKQAFSNQYMKRQIDQMLEAIEKNPADAIGKAKDLIETCCKTILSERGVDNTDQLDVPTLIKEMKEKLELKSEHQAVRQIVGGLSGVATGIAQLRNAKGTGHGKNTVKFREPSPIEARLSVDSAITLTRFYWDLHKKKPAK